MKNVNVFDNPFDDAKDGDILTPNFSSVDLLRALENFTFENDCDCQDEDSECLVCEVTQDLVNVFEILTKAQRKVRRFNK
jgi:hypothetical protein